MSEGTYEYKDEPLEFPKLGIDFTYNKKQQEKYEELRRKSRLYDAMVKWRLRLSPHGEIGDTKWAAWVICGHSQAIEDRYFDTYEQAIDAFLEWAEQQEADNGNT